MPHEIERKFLLRPPTPSLEGRCGQEIDQGYIADHPQQVRLRRIDGKRFILTVKSGDGLVRGEHEIDLSQKQFEALWPLTSGRRLRKTRYEMPHGDLIVEIDVYRGKHTGLIVAEVEFPSEAAAHAFQPPSWLGEDISADLRYANRTLATE